MHHSMPGAMHFSHGVEFTTPRYQNPPFSGPYWWIGGDVFDHLHIHIHTDYDGTKGWLLNSGIHPPQHSGSPDRRLSQPVNRGVGHGNPSTIVQEPHLIKRRR